MPRKIQLPELLIQLPQPTGTDIKSLLDRKHWTYKQFAEIVGVEKSGQRQTLRYIKDEQPLNNARWSMALLVAGEHPTMQLVPRDAQQAADLGLHQIAPAGTKAAEHA